MTLDELQLSVKLFHMRNNLPSEIKGISQECRFEARILSRQLHIVSLALLDKSIMTKDKALFRIHMLCEELSETLLGFYEKNELKIFDGTLDSIYVHVGNLSLFDLPLKQGIKEVVRSNDTKSYGDVLSDGRRDKGPNYSPPNLKKVIDDFRNNR